MTPELEAWKNIREQGKWPYTLRWMVSWGTPMVFAQFFLSGPPKPLSPFYSPTSTYPLPWIAVVAALGYILAFILGLILWNIHERAFRTALADESRHDLGLAAAGDGRNGDAPRATMTDAQQEPAHWVGNAARQATWCQSARPWPTRPPYPDEAQATTTDNRQRKHSGLGIASFVTSIAAGALVFLLVSTTASTQGRIDGASSTVIGFSFIALFVAEVIALMLGIGGAAEKNRKKAFAILGMILSFLPLALFGAIALSAVSQVK